jgi:hypothetical protein
MNEVIFMMKEKTRGQVWLRLPGYRVTALKAEFRERAVELERVIRDGIPAIPDSVRTDFYDVALKTGVAYIHVDWRRHAVYLVAHFPSSLNSVSVQGAGRTHDEFYAAVC